MANQAHLDKLKEGVESWNMWRELNINIRPNLQHEDFSKANLKKVNLKGAYLEETIFQGADLKDADFEGANLILTNLKRANLIRANFKGAQLVRTNFEGAVLDSANFGRADVSGVIFKGAYLTGTNFEGAVLYSANLIRADLRNANFEETKVIDIKYNRWSRYNGIRVSTCYGSPRFKRFAQDQDYLEEFRKSKWRFPIYLIWLVFADCGRSILLWTLWSLAIAIFFAYQYLNMGQEVFQVNNLHWGLNAMIYYSLVTFTTLGLGDITPKTIEATRWVMAEVIIGYIMLGGLISIFANKLSRRA